MADSDDEYDRRRGRDKFHRERNDYNDRNTNNRRDDWSESWSSQRDRIPRRDYRDNYNSAGGGGGGGGGRMNYIRNDRYSPADRTGDMSPPAKRIRGGRDWDDRYSNYDGGASSTSGGGGGGGNASGYHTSHHGQHYRDNWGHDRDRDDESYQPPMMTWKQFVNEQDDHLDAEEMIAKYNEYKNEFKKTQLQEFFNRHKDEEWFRCKYHPDEIEKRKTKLQQSYQNRLNVFMELYNAKYMENVSLDVDKNEQIIKVLDAAVIKLEGGTDFDLLALNNDVDDQQTKSKDSIFAVDSSSTKKAFSSSSSSLLTNTGDNASLSDQPPTPKMVDDENSNTGEIKESEDEKTEEGETSGKLSAKEEIKEESGDGELMEEGEDASKDMFPETTKNENEVEVEKKPRALHKTCSIFFRNLAPSITRQEIEDECRKFPGFLRLAISEPQIDRRFNRRAWATYERTVNIREICWNLNNIKIRGTELSPIVNRDLTRRIRSVNGITSHKSVVRADIRHAAKLVMKLDAQKKLWEDEIKSEDQSENRNGSLATPSRNPLLKNITDYLIEEAPAEEAELLGTSVEDPLVTTELGEASGETNGNAATSSEAGTQFERDEDLIKVLDRLILYLRIVHSVDYYNHCEYPNEDEMPNRIGLIHARGLISSARVTPLELNDFIKEQENKIQPLLQATPEVTPEQAKKLGLKDIDEAVEAFIKENTKELGEGKWLCPLSNKKFMGPEFVKKHILNKHMERVEQVIAETHYFNNYILDPKRPQLPEHPSNRPPSQQNQQQQQQSHRHDQISGPGGFGTGGGGGGSGSGGGGGGYNQRMGNHGGMHGFGGGMHGLGGGYGGGGNRYGGGGGGGYMPPILPVIDQYLRHNLKRRYRDLDAPPEE